MNNKKTQINRLLSAAIILGGLFVFSPARAQSDLVQGIINQVNQERASQGLEQLKENETLSQAAALKAKDMVGNNYFAHTSPAGIDPWYWLEQVGYQYKYAGENLAMDFSSAVSVHRAWMKSETHRDNILSDKYTEIGVAVLEGILENKETRVAVQLFGAPSGETKISQLLNATDEFGEPVMIEEASVKFWEGTLSDEMIVYSRVKGSPEKVSVLIGKQEIPLENLNQNKYMNLVSLKELDLDNNQIIVKAKIKDNQSVFFEIPKHHYAQWQQKKEGGEEKYLTTSVASVKAAALLNKEKSLDVQNLLMFGFMLVCLIMIANVWFLEKEEEKLLERVVKATVS